MVKLHKFKIQKKSKKNTAEIKQKYIIPRQTQKRKIYSEPIVHIRRETTHENENTDKKNKVEVNSNASRILNEKENTRSSEPLLHKVEVESNASRIPKEKEDTRSSEPLLHKVEVNSNASRIPNEKENRRSSEPLLHKVEVNSNASRIPNEKENRRSSEPLLHKDYHKNKTDQQVKIYPEEISQKDGKSENKTTQGYQQLNPKSLTFTCTDTKRRKLEEEQSDYDNEEYTLKKESKRNRKSQKQYKQHQLSKEEKHADPAETEYYAEDKQETDSYCESEFDDNEQKGIPEYLLTR